MSLDTGLSRVAIAGIVVSAAIQALDAALAGRANLQAHLPSFITAEFYQFVPMTLVAIAGLAWLLKLVLPKKVLGATGAVVQIKGYKTEMERVELKEFLNDRIELDGRHFFRCVFTNVTFVYNGKGDTKIEDCKFADNAVFQLLTENSGIKNYMGIVDMLRSMPAATKMVTGEVHRETGKFWVKSQFTSQPPQGSGTRGKGKKRRR